MGIFRAAVEKKREVYTVYTDELKGKYDFNEYPTISDKAITVCLLFIFGVTLLAILLFSFIVASAFIGGSISWSHVARVLYPIVCFQTTMTTFA